MTIKRIPSHVVRPAGAGGVAGADGKKDKEGPGDVGRVERTDRVEISEQGRALAEQIAPAEGAGEEHTAAREATIRERIADGTYNRSDTAAEVAERILLSGDLG